MNPDNGNIIPGGQGACSLRDLFDPGHERQGCTMLASALKAGYVDIFSIDYPAVKRKAKELSEDEDKRVSAAGTKLLVAMAQHDLKLLELLEGAPEDRVQVHEHRHFIVPPPRVLGEG